MRFERSRDFNHMQMSIDMQCFSVLLL